MSKRSPKGGAAARPRAARAAVARAAAARVPNARLADARTPAVRSTTGVHVSVLRLAHAQGLPLPAYQTAGAAGLDLLAAMPSHTTLTLKPRSRALVPTGLVLELPPGYEAQVRPRSGLAMREGVTVLNSPGTIDSDYRGEVQVLLVNLGERAVRITRGERIAQLVVAPVVQADLVEVTTTSRTARGAGGFGSTGRAAAGAKQRSAPGKAAGAKAKPRGAPAGRPRRSRSRGEKAK